MLGRAAASLLLFIILIEVYKRVDIIQLTLSIMILWGGLHFASKYAKLYVTKSSSWSAVRYVSTVVKAFPLSLVFVAIFFAYEARPFLLAQIVVAIVAGFFVLAAISEVIKARKERHLSDLKPGPSVFALVTGASGGIGLEIALNLASLGYNLVLIARNGARLELVAAEVKHKWGVKVYTMATDLSAPEAARSVYDHTVRVMKELGGHVDILVNNAGVATRGDFIGLPPDNSEPRPPKCDLARQTAMIRLNTVAAVELAGLFGSDMASRRCGRILNVSSIVGAAPGPRNVVYSATKAFLTSFSLGLRYELLPCGVGVTTLCPGATHTHFSAEMGGEDALIFALPLPGLQMHAKEVAVFGVKQMLRGVEFATPGLLNIFMMNAAFFFPRHIISWLTDVLWGKKPSFF